MGGMGGPEHGHATSSRGDGAAALWAIERSGGFLGHHPTPRLIPRLELSPTLTGLNWGQLSDGARLLTAADGERCDEDHNRDQGRWTGYSPSSSLAASPPASPMRSTETTCSSSAVSNTITPWVDRPAMRMPVTGTRISCPPSVTSMSSSLSSTGNEATSEPLRALTAMAAMPLPPRPATRYSNEELRLP